MKFCFLGVNVRVLEVMGARDAALLVTCSWVAVYLSRVLCHISQGDSRDYREAVFFATFRASDDPEFRVETGNPESSVKPNAPLHARSRHQSDVFGPSENTNLLWELVKIIAVKMLCHSSSELYMAFMLMNKLICNTVN